MNEFQFLNGLRSRYSLDKTGDDCSVLSHGPDTDLLLTADMLVEDIDFRLEWTTPEFLGHKALAVSLSDIAAMGGSAKWSMLSIGISAELWNTGFLDRFYKGWFDLASNHGVELVGGDISRTQQHLVIDSIVGGEVLKGKAILRSTARPGDAIFLSGIIGGAAGGLKLIETGLRYRVDMPAQKGDLLLAQLKPQPELIFANSLQQLNIVTSAIDVSDGLSSDLGHLCYESRTGAVIYADRLPINPNLSSNFSTDESLQMALNGGEDFRLLFTADPQNILRLKSIGASHIGEMTTNVGSIELSDDERSKLLDPGGFSHF